MTIHPARTITLVMLLFLGVQVHVHGQVTSENNEQLRGALKRYPLADANKDGVLTLEEARTFLQKRAGEVVPPTHADVRYGTHGRNVLDLWIVKSEQPTPLLVCIHGGGFSGGDKKNYHRNGKLIRGMHAAGISVAAINYRLTEGGKHPYPAAMQDGARAVQFLRHKAATYNLAPEHFGATGGSAGGCMLMWLGFHDDLADPANDDPVSRQSTRLQALAPNAGQSCLHLPTLLEWFQVKSLVEHGGGRPFFGIPKGAELVITEKLDRTMRDASPIFHLTKDDPPCFMTFGPNQPVDESSDAGLWVHHPIMGFKLQEAMAKIGLECHVQYKGGPAITSYKSQQDFLIKKLAAPKP